ncbi:MAG: CAP domain-containing protein [Verrucomicrobiia bacterium]
MNPSAERLILSLAFLWLTSASLATSTPPNLTQAITDEINQIRVSAQLPPLLPDRNLSALAGEWSDRMARRNRLSHRSDLLAQMRRLGYRSINENIFYATGPVTAREVVAAWMNSPGHRRNLLAPMMNRIGVGQAVNRSGVTYFTFNSAQAENS